MEKTTYTTISLGNFTSREDGEIVRGLLRESLKEAFIAPDIGLAPMGGSFDLVLTTTYVFTDDEGEPVEDNEKALLKFMLSNLTFELWNVLRKRQVA